MRGLFATGMLSLLVGVSAPVVAEVKLYWPDLEKLVSGNQPISRSVADTIANRYVMKTYGVCVQHEGNPEDAWGYWIVSIQGGWDIAPHDIYISKQTGLIYADSLEHKPLVQSLSEL